MSQIHIHRKHQFGLAEARRIAWEWAEEVEQKFDMECTVIEGETSDTVCFKRTGVSGELIVAKGHFELDAKLGFLLGAFSKTIEAEIERNLDALLQSHAGAAASKAKPAAAAKSATKTAGSTAAAKKSRKPPG